MENAVEWVGAEYLREYLEPVGSLPIVRDVPDEALLMVADGLRKHGQTRPVLIDPSQEIVARGHLVVAARILGWTHVAVRLEASELAIDDQSQMSLIEEVERRDPAESKLDDIQALGRRKDLVEISEDGVEQVNVETADESLEWIGLPEFVGAEDPFKVVISCETEADREALFDVLGIATIHKGTRGTFSVWWPDRKKKDLSSLRFEEA